MLFENPTPESGDASTETETIQTAETPETTEVESPESLSPETSDLESDDQSDDEGISLSDFADNLGLTDEDLDFDEEGKIVFKTKIDGKEGRLKPSEYKTAYQKQGHLDNLTREATAKLESIKARETELDGQYSQKLNQLDDVFNLAWQELNNSYNQINWQELDEDDPGKAANLRVQFGQRDQQIKDTLARINQERLNKQQEAYTNYLVEQDKELIKHFPAWSDQTLGKKELGEIQDYGSSFGYQPGEIIDNRLIRVLDKARKFDELETSKPEINKQVKKARKVARPGTSQTKEVPKRAADILYG